MATIIHKTTVAEIDDLFNIVASDMTEDSYSDIVGDPSAPDLGWRLKRYMSNPVVLDNHDKNKRPVATVEGLRIEKGQLVGRLKMAPKGTSQEIDELLTLIRLGILKGISVGFIPIRSVPRKNGKGTHFLEQELIEISLVSVPSNPAALLQAKSLGVRKETIVRLFKMQTRNAAKQNKRYAAAEMVAINRKAKAMVARLKSKSKPQEPLLSPAQKQKIEQQKYNNEVLRRAKERNARYQAEKDERKKYDLLARQDDPPYESDDTYFTWRGVKIPVPRFGGKKQW